MGNFLTQKIILVALTANQPQLCKDSTRGATKLYMQITAQTDPISSNDTFTPHILILETDHDVTAQGGNSAALQTALDARQICIFADDSFRDHGVPMSALND